MCLVLYFCAYYTCRISLDVDISYLVLTLQAIHKKIMSLNFRDCHAKIRQVDSQATIDNAVVVQVYFTSYIILTVELLADLC